ncbi:MULTISPECIES: YihY/virulence factor BrkB family protein [Psychrilyobacter]|uniref:YihY/virulence factor BrkB family protein n=1 Tax=Psychrilyobacter TaxID=623282 RepID=UPI0013144D62|nr:MULTISPECIES: YihY/virulence factor BrkB family protein [Psychrilyobacter]MCS5421385.1 YihY/virulence factor BrkB family protein [Psychrilyobacter sp. S5]NDI78471.1 YihY/virulence factor BrkB family protein [Psychrilyobacter piezotolerans]
MKLTIKKFIEVTRKQISQSNKLIFKILKLILFTFENYKKSRSDLWSSALTFYSLLTIVPVIAIAFVITRGFGIEKMIKEELYKTFFIQDKILDQILVFSQKTLENTKSELIAGTGILFLIWSVVKIFSAVERSFNEIWKVEESRSFVRKLTDYMSLIFLFPLIVVLSNGLSAILKIFILKIYPGLIGVLNFIPQILVIIFFTLIYLIIPNTKVKLSTAFIAGLFSGIVFQITQSAFIHLQVSLLNYNAIYGSFSLIPIFIMWQKIVWFIILLGAHLSFIIQNSYKYSYTINEINLNFSSKRDISIICIYYLIRNYEENRPPMSTNELSHKLGIAIGVTQDILNMLAKLKFIVEIVTSSDERKYKISKNIDILSIGYVISQITQVGYSQEVGEESREILEKIDKAIENFQYDLLLKDIEI